MKYLVVTVFLFLILSSGCDLWSQARLESVSIKTRMKENALVTVYYRVPASYEPEGKKQHRVLVIFGGRNNTGKEEAGGRLG